MISPPPKRQPIPFGKYLLLDRVNIGGMAEVWRAKRYAAGGMELLVAIKRILPNIAEDEEFIAMFIDEAKISVQLAHANVAKVQDLGHIANNYFIEVEYIPGKDMRAIFDRCRKLGERAPIPLVVHCVAKMCEALDYAHRKKDGQGREMNIVHRDVSPQNVLISYEGDVKVIDFGIAKAAGKATRTQAGILKGKFGYMSPEQIRGGQLDGRSDVFAIGVCLYELLTGERLFVGESDYAVLEKVRKAEVPPPSGMNPKIPPALETIVLKALAREVEQRYQHASELADDLQRFLLTSGELFTRKDLVQYMRETFAEDVEREAQRLAEYAEVRAPPEVLAAAEAGYNGLSVPPASAPTMLSAPAPAARHGVAYAASPQPSTTAYHRGPSLSAPLRLSAVPSAAPADADDEQREATIMVDSRGYYDAPPEPLTHPSALPAAWPSRKPEADDTSRNLNAAPITDSYDLPPGVDPSPSSSAALRLTRSQEGYDDEDAELATSGTRGKRLPWGLIGAALVALFGVAFGTSWLLREPPSGFLMLDVPAEMRAGARVTLNGEDLGVPTSWPVVQRTRAGRAQVSIDAPGYLPFEQSVNVMEGQQVTLLTATLQKEGKRGKDRGGR